LTEGTQWTRRQWAEARLAQRFSKRIPAAVNQATSEAQAEAELYINEYKICMHHLLDDQGQRLFPPKLRLITHWNLRDEIKAQYRAPDQGLARQRLIQRVLERIIDQSIPAAVINNPQVDWNPVSNQVSASPVNDLDQPAPAGFKPENTPNPILATSNCSASFRPAARPTPSLPPPPP